jgi:hypothetical protein
MRPCPDPWPTSGEPAAAVPDENAERDFHRIDKEEWDDTLPLEVEPVPALLPVGCDAYVKPRHGRVIQYRWLVVESAGDGAEPAGDSWIGRRGDAHDAATEVGWAAVLDVRWTRCGHDWADWLLRAGVASGQHFLVRVEYRAWRDAWGESADAVVGEVAARGPAPVAPAWGSAEFVAAMNRWFGWGARVLALCLAVVVGVTACDAGGLLVVRDGGCLSTCCVAEGGDGGCPGLDGGP